MSGALVPWPEAKAKLLKLRNRQDGRVHFSELKAMALSPAHYRQACTEPKEATQAMLIGSATDRYVFGGAVVVYEGRRDPRVKEWQAFQVEHANKLIISKTEHEVARATADCVLADPVAGPLLRAPGNEFQRVMAWEAYGGVECAAGIAGEHGRGGFDLINQRESVIIDLKASGDAEPDSLMRHARRMLWHAQGRWYLDGAQALSLDATRFKLIVAETSGVAVTVLTLGPKVLERAAQQIQLWVERLKGCDATGEFPGYQQSEVEWDEVEEEGLVW
jgi:hypothetical protein